MSGHHNFKLDMGSVEREEDRAEFFSACGNLDSKNVYRLVNLRKLSPAEVLDRVGQNGIHYVVGSAKSEREDSAKQTSLISYLVSQGADVNCQRSTDGWTPLHLAAAFGAATVVTELLSSGAKADIRDGDDTTAEDLASKFKMRNVKDILLHRRSKVPHSRFSCVMLSPAIELGLTPPASDAKAEAKAAASASPEEEEEDTQSVDDSTEQDLLQQPPQESAEPCSSRLLTAQ